MLKSVKSWNVPILCVSKFSCVPPSVRGDTEGRKKAFFSGHIFAVQPSCIFLNTVFQSTRPLAFMVTVNMMMLTCSVVVVISKFRSPAHHASSECCYQRSTKTHNKDDCSYEAPEHVIMVGQTVRILQHQIALRTSTSAVPGDLPTAAQTSDHAPKHTSTRPACTSDVHTHAVCSARHHHSVSSRRHVGAAHFRRARGPANSRPDLRSRTQAHKHTTSVHQRRPHACSV